MGFFESRTTKEKKSHLKNLVDIAGADGNIDVKERNLIRNIGMKMGLQETDILCILSDPASVKKNVVPRTLDKRLSNLIDLTAMVIIDGRVTEDEKTCCKEAATSMDFPPGAVNPLVETTISMVRSYKSDDEILTTLKSILDRH